MILISLHITLHIDICTFLRLCHLHTIVSCLLCLIEVDHKVLQLFHVLFKAHLFQCLINVLLSHLLAPVLLRDVISNRVDIEREVT